MTRRSFLTLPAIAPLTRLGFARESAAHHFSYDHVLGTSMDLTVWTSNPAAAERVEKAVVDEIHRLAAILNTRHPDSEISQFEQGGQQPSRELAEVFSAYDRWNKQTNGVLSIHPAGPGTSRNVDALGKAYIIDRAVAVAMAAAPHIDGLLLNIGGDIVVRGRPCEIAIKDPAASQDNAAPITYVQLENAAIATSGAYARGAHLLDARTGQPVLRASGATVVARDAVTANALATTLCVTDAKEGMQFVENTPGAAAFRVGMNGEVQRTSGFARFERARMIPVAVAADWPAGYELNIALTLTAGAPPFGGRGFGGPGGAGPAGPGGAPGGGAAPAAGPGGGAGPFGGRGGAFVKRQFVAVWVENSSGKLVRVLACWMERGKNRYFNELATFFTLVDRDYNRINTLATATRNAGDYHLVWDGLDDKKAPVPPGTYRIVVETNQEHGAYGKQAGTIECGDKPAELMLPKTSNFDAVTIQYGPKPKQA